MVALSSGIGLDLGDKLYRAFFVFGTLLLWQGVTAIANLPEFVLPSPLAVAREISQHKSQLAAALIATSWKSAIGLLMAGAFALLIVTTGYRRHAIQQSIVSVAGAIEAVPKIIFAPILTVWFGIGAEPKITLAAMLCIYPMLQRLLTAWHSCPPEILQFARALGASDPRIIWRVRLRWMLPDILEAVKLAIPLAFVGVIVGELIASRDGIGPMMMRALGDLNMALVMAAALLVAVTTGVIVAAVEFTRSSLVMSGRYADA